MNLIYSAEIHWIWKMIMDVQKYNRQCSMLLCGYFASSQKENWIAKSTSDRSIGISLVLIWYLWKWKSGIRFATIVHCICDRWRISDRPRMSDIDEATLKTDSLNFVRKRLVLFVTSSLLSNRKRCRILERERSNGVQRIPFLLLRKWLVSDTKLLLFVYVTCVALFFVFFFWLSRFQFNNIESMCTYLFCLFWRGCISFSSKQKVFNVSNNDKELVSIFCFSSWCVWMAGMFFSLTLWFWNWSVCQQNGNTMTVSTHEHRMSRNYSR